MSGLGRFLEFSVRTTDILESLNFYKALGFRELVIGDMWPHRYAVVSDGLLCIGLHDREFDSPAVSFIQQDLAKHYRSMTDHGFLFTDVKLDEDVFNEISLKDHDGNLLTMVEARTYNFDEEDDDNSVCGTFFEITLPVRSATRAARFWGSLTHKVEEMREEPTIHMRFEAGGISLGVSESIALAAPSLCFREPDTDMLNLLIERHGIKQEKFPGFEGAQSVITAPEGTRLFIFDEDFLGEPIEVEESEDTSSFPAAAMPNHDD